ncbi:hypothetical protein [Paenibacillus agricola]|uniref:DUF2953 domain-containing protein n=1 Tax=Paenibacillus agricola TaxID=2716264 RepID=A0ABX0JED8_9BACL|nr:hypothetical protein [Paenibacillus agricola]NHN34814.1 hypothetical protein [Paenibacillus agricola]
MIDNILVILMAVGLIALCFIVVPASFIFHKKKKGLFLNKRYICSWNKSYEAYEIHCFVRYVIWRSSSTDYKADRKEAVEILKQRYPDNKIIAITAMLQYHYENELRLVGIPIHYSFLKRISVFANNIFSIFLNVSNWFHVRKTGEWQILHLVNRAWITPPKCYVIHSPSNKLTSLRSQNPLRRKTQ